MTKAIIAPETIVSKILLIRRKRVMLDNDLAVLYGVPTKSLNLAVKRNLDRFPKDFMFQLNKQEYADLRLQIETSKRGGRRYMPYAFTEQGVAMLSSVLNSKRAIQVNIQIMRTFVKIKEILMTHKNLQRKIQQMEKKYNQQFRVVFDAIRQLIKEEQKPKKSIGFHSR